MTLTLQNSRLAAIIDDDMGHLAQFKWYLMPSGYVIRSLYENKAKRTIRLHREVFGAQRGQELDHVNRDKLDNRRSNLRLASRQTNCANVPPSRRNGSGYKGVHRRLDMPHAPWRAAIRIDGALRHLGNYASREEAAKAYDRAASVAFGEFAWTNFPPERRAA